MSEPLSGTIRLARDADALALYEIRRLAILSLAPPTMPWHRAGLQSTSEWMHRFLQKRTVWVFESGGEIRLEASLNAEESYRKRGYRAAGPRPSEHDALPMSKAVHGG